MKYQTRITIDRPVEEVWGFMDNPENMRRWLKGFKSFTPLSGKPGAVGSKTRQVYMEGNRHIELIEEVLEREEYQKLRFKRSHPQVQTRQTILFKDLDGRTEIETISDTQFQSFAYQLLAPLMKGSFARRQRQDFQRLKQILEGEYPNVQ